MAGTPPPTEMPQQPQQQPYGPYAQPYQAPVQPKQPPIIPAMYLWLCLIGIIIMVVGLMLSTSSAFLIDTEGGGYDSNVVRNLGATGNIIGAIGVLLLSVGLLAPAFMVRGMGPYVRIALFIAAALIIGLYFG